MVVIGDSLFLSNQMIDKEGNRELAWHTVNWLLDRSHLLQLSDRSRSKRIGLNLKPMNSKPRRHPGGVDATQHVDTGNLVWLRRRT